MYKITIEKTEEVKKVQGREWRVVDTVEVGRDRTFITTDEPKTRIKDVMGYTPEIEQEVSVTTRVLEQTVDVLDLKAVIAVINGICVKA